MKLKVDKIYKLTTETFIGERTRIPAGGVGLKLENGVIMLSNDFNHSRKHKLEVYVYLPYDKKWVKTFKRDEYTEMLWDYHRKTERKSRLKNASSFMKHDRKHKSGGGGQRIGHSGTVTDYECSKNPLHDFRRVYN